MEFLLIIIVVVIISVISAAAKKKAKSSQQQHAPERPVMSDIQKAFMMAAGIPDEDKTPPRPAPRTPQRVTSYSGPVSAPFVRPAAPATESSMGDSGHEGPGWTSVQSASPYQGIQISSYFMDEKDDETENLKPRAVLQEARAAHIALFENQRDVVKAVIYSEILPRKGRRARF